MVNDSNLGVDARIRGTTAWTLPARWAEPTRL